MRWHSTSCMAPKSTSPPTVPTRRSFSVMPIRRRKRAAAVAEAAVAAGGAAGAKPRVLLVAPRDSYRTAPYIAAARAQGVDLLIASEGRQTLSGLEMPGVQVNLHALPGSLQALLSAAQAQPFNGVIGTDDASSEFAVQDG